MAQSLQPPRGCAGYSRIAGKPMQTSYQATSLILSVDSDRTKHKGARVMARVSVAGSVNVLLASIGRNGSSRPRKGILSLQEVWNRLSMMPGTEFRFNGGYLRENGTLDKTSGAEKVRVVGSLGGAGHPMSLIVEFCDDPGTNIMVNWKFHGIRNFECGEVLNTCDTLLKRSRSTNGFVRDTQSVKGTRKTVKGIRAATLKKGSPIKVH